jgi:hypothetical protein
MLKILLPYLIRLDQEQMVEKEIEAKRQGICSSNTLTSCLSSYYCELLYMLCSFDS